MTQSEIRVLNSPMAVLPACTTSLRSQMSFVYTKQASSPLVDASHSHPTTVITQITPRNQTVFLSQAAHPPVDAFYNQKPLFSQSSISAAQFEPPTQTAQPPSNLQKSSQSRQYSCKPRYLNLRQFMYTTDNSCVVIMMYNKQGFLRSKTAWINHAWSSALFRKLPQCNYFYNFIYNHRKRCACGKHHEIFILLEVLSRSV